MEAADKGVNPFREPTLFDEIDGLRWRIQRLMDRRPPGLVHKMLAQALDMVARALEELQRQERKAA